MRRRARIWRLPVADHPMCVHSAVGATTATTALETAGQPPALVGDAVGVVVVVVAVVGAAVGGEVAGGWVAGGWVAGACVAGGRVVGGSVSAVGATGVDVVVVV